MSTTIILLNLLLVVLFVRRQYRKHGSFLQLGIIFVASLTLGYPIRLLMVAYSDDVVTEFPLSVYRDSLLELSVISCLGMGLFMLAYAWVDGRRGQYRFLCSDSTDRANEPIALVWFLLFVSILGKLIKIGTGNYVSFLLAQGADLAYSNVVENMHRAGWVALAAIWILFFRGKLTRFKDLLLLCFVTGLEFTYQIIQGSKTFLMLPLLILALCYYYSKKRVPLIFGAFAIVFMVLFVFPFVSAFRDVMQRDYHGIPSISNFDPITLISETARVAFFDDSIANPHGVPGSASATALQRFGAADELLRFVEVVPRQLPYKYGADFLGVLFSIIPRAVWPDKPIFSPGAEFGAWLNTITSVTPFPIGEMYWNGGYLGVIFGMLLWGVTLAFAMRLTGRLFWAKGAQLYVVAIFLAELYWFTSMESMLPMVIASLIQKTIIYFVLFKIFKIFTSRRHHGIPLSERR